MSEAQGAQILSEVVVIYGDVQTLTVLVEGLYRWLGVFVGVVCVGLGVLACRVYGVGGAKS